MFNVIALLWPALQLVDPELLDRCDATLQDSTECALHKPELHNFNSREEETSESQKKVQVDHIHVPCISFVSNDRIGENIKQQELQKANVRLNANATMFFKITCPEYSKYDRHSGTKKLHLIIKEPPLCPTRSSVHSIRPNAHVSNKVDGKEISEFRSFSEEVLLPYGYVAIPLPFYS